MVKQPASLGGIVRDRRLALGYSLGQLATKLSKTASSIRAWEKGEAYPNEHEIDLLADVLDLDTETLTALLPDSEVWAADPVQPVDVNDPWTEDGSEPEDSSEAEDDGDDADNPEASAESTASEDADGGAADDPVDADGGGDPADAADDELVDAVQASGDGAASGDDPGSGGGGSSVHEALTEAVPVVPSTAVAVADPTPGSPLATASTQPFGGAANPVLAAWDQVLDWYRRVFDPRHKWIYRVRYVLLVIAFFIMLRVLAWAGSNLLDAVGEVLDSFSFSPSETPDVQN